jgi:hypothetical protein
VPLEDHGDPLASRRAGGQERQLAVAVEQAVDRVHGQADAGRAKRVT